MKFTRENFRRFWREQRVKFVTSRAVYRHTEVTRELTDEEIARFDRAFAKFAEGFDELKHILDK